MCGSYLHSCPTFSSSVQRDVGIFGGRVVVEAAFALVFGKVGDVVMFVAVC